MDKKPKAEQEQFDTRTFLVEAAVDGSRPQQFKLFREPQKVVEIVQVVTSYRREAEELRLILVVARDRSLNLKDRETRERKDVDSGRERKGKSQKAE